MFSVSGSVQDIYQREEQNHPALKLELQLNCRQMHLFELLTTVQQTLKNLIQPVKDWIVART